MNTNQFRSELNQLKYRLFETENDLIETKNRERCHATKRRHKERLSAMQKLESEGYQFDLAKEFEHVKDLTAKQFALHLQRVRKNYKKASRSLGKPAKLSAADERRVKVAAKKRTDHYRRTGLRIGLGEALREVDRELATAN